MEKPEKYSLKELTGPFDSDNEGTIRDARGSLVQIVDGTGSFSHLVYLDLIVSDPPVYRGVHYHERKVEIFYIISGRVEVHLADLDTDWRKTLLLAPGMKLTLLPRLAHQFRALEYAQIIEASPQAYDPRDVFPYTF